MNSIENRKNFIENAYRQAVGAGLADSKQDFANKVGVSPVTMSKAMNGAEGYATEKLCEKIKAAFPTLEVQGNVKQIASGNGTIQVVGTANDCNTLDNAITAVNDAHGIIKTMQQQMNVLLDIIKNQQ